MKKLLSVTCMALMSFAMLGCQGGDSTSSDLGSSVNEATQPVSLVYCGKCGNEKGAAACCAVDAEVCTLCNLHKGSALCCKVSAADLAGNDVCGKCGQVAGSEQCCKEGAEVCTLCSLHKGSALCCKLTATSSTGESTDGPNPSDLE